ncbi:MAG: hypothetical protein AAB443_02675 [Patescibacteria group bacterium]
MAEMIFATFFKGHDGVIARIEGKVSFPERGWAPKVGETYQVKIVGQSKSGKAQFLRKVTGPYYAVEGAQRQYGWYSTGALGKPDIEFQSGFSGGSAYYTAIWTKIPYAEAKQCVDKVRALNEWAHDSNGLKANCGGIYGTMWYQSEYPVTTAIVSGLTAGLSVEAIKKFCVSLMEKFRNEELAKEMSSLLSARGEHYGYYKIPRSWVGDYPYDPKQIVEGL